MALVIHKPGADVDGKTGMTRFRVHVEDAHPVTGKITQGPMETIALYPQALLNLTGKDPTPETAEKALREWMAARYAELRIRKHHLETVSTVVAKLAGQTLEFD